MKRLLIALALTCVLSGSVFAGDMDTAGAPAPVAGETQGPGITATVILTILSLIR
jgi:hypothetical protein